MTASDPSNVHSLPASQPAAPIAGLRPGDIDLSDPKTFLQGVPHPSAAASSPRIVRPLSSPVVTRLQARIDGDT